MKKKVLIGIGGILLVLVIFTWQVVVNLDSIVAGVIEDVGSDVLKTKVSVSDVSISLKEGKASIGGLTVANPKGYSRANLFAMEGIKVDLDLQSLGKDVLVIQSIRIRNPQIVFEGDDAGGSNMQTLLNNIQGASGGDSEAVGGEVTKVIIEQFELSGAQVRATSALLPDKVTEFILPSIKMSGIGRAQGGVTTDVAAKQIASKLANSVAEAALKAGINKVLKEKAKGIEDVLGAVLRGKKK